MLKDKNVTFLFRSKDLHAFSVEKLFSSIIPIIREKCNVREVYMPCFRVSFRNLLQNIIYARKVYKESEKDTIFHITGDVYYISIGLPRKRTVLTVLDTVSLSKSKGIKKFLLKLLWFTIPIHICKYISVISEKTKNEIVKLYPRCEDKITVIPCPVDNEFKITHKTFNESNPIILQVGTKENKNLRRVIEAIEGIQCELHIIGQLTQEEIDLLGSKKIKYINKVHIPDEEIVSEYKKCDILIFVSTYEGFGMPIIEAQASGKIVITSNIEPMISVSDNAAYLVDPFNVSEIRSTVINAIKDSGKREMLISRGVENAKKYRTDIIATEYMDLYEKVNKSIVKN